MILSWAWQLFVWPNCVHSSYRASLAFIWCLVSGCMMKVQCSLSFNTVFGVYYLLMKISSPLAAKMQKSIPLYYCTVLSLVFWKLFNRLNVKLCSIPCEILKDSWGRTTLTGLERRRWAETWETPAGTILLQETTEVLCLPSLLRKKNTKHTEWEGKKEVENEHF